MNNIEMYIMVFIEEEEKWYYFKEEFDEDQLNGFSEYYITVEDGIILEDTYNQTNKGLKFTGEYDILLWKK